MPRENHDTSWTSKLHLDSFKSALLLLPLQYGLIFNTLPTIGVDFASLSQVCAFIAAIFSLWLCSVPGLSEQVMLICRKSSGGLCSIVGVCNSHAIHSSIPAPPPPHPLNPGRTKEGVHAVCPCSQTPLPLINRLRGDRGCLLCLGKKGLCIGK